MNFNEAFLRGVDIRGADLYGANFQGASLHGSDARDSNLFQINFSGADLRSVDLARADLRGADMRSTDLSGADLRSALLSRADLRSANLSGADLRGTDLRGALLRYADLTGAVLRSADLTGADLRRVKAGGVALGDTVLLSVDLSPFCDAEPPILHKGPSYIDFRSILKSAHSPRLRDFLKRTGVPDAFIEHEISSALSLHANTGEFLNPTFLSYGGADEPFVKKLYEALHCEGVPTFFFPEHAETKRKGAKPVTEGLEHRDRLLLLCSRASLTRRGILTELEAIFEREARDGGAFYLFPVLVDSYIFTSWRPPNADVAQALRDRIVADFEGADRDDGKFIEELFELLTALRKPSPPKPPSSL